MNVKEKIEELREASEDGTITAAQVTEAGLHRSVLQKFYLQEQLEAWKKQFDKEEELFLSEAETERFLREWTVKESYVKLTGTGLSRDLRALMVDWNQNRVEEADRPGWGSRFCEYPVPEDYFLSACSCPEEV